MMDSRKKLLLFRTESAKKLIKIKIKEEEEEWINEVKDENFKHSTYIALNCSYMGQSLPWTNNIVI